MITAPSCNAVLGKKIVFNNSTVTSASNFTPFSIYVFKFCVFSIVIIAPIFLDERYAAAATKVSISFALAPASVIEDFGVLTLVT